MSEVRYVTITAKMDWRFRVYHRWLHFRLLAARVWRTRSANPRRWRHNYVVVSGALDDLQKDMERAWLGI